MAKKEKTFDDDILIHRLYVMMRLFTKTLNDNISPAGIYSSEWAVLNYLTHHDHMLQSEIAQALEIEPAAISKTLSKMEKKGLVSKSSLKDKREKYISLAATVQAHREKALDGLSEKQLKTMLKAISQMNDNLKH